MAKRCSKRRGARMHRRTRRGGWVNSGFTPDARSGGGRKKMMRTRRRTRMGGQAVTIPGGNFGGGGGVIR